MLEETTTFVLGAGSSMPYTFNLSGKQLWEILCHSKNSALLLECGHSPKDMDEFRSLLRSAENYGAMLEPRGVSLCSQT